MLMEGKHFNFLDQQTEDSNPDNKFCIFDHWHFTMRGGWDYTEDDHTFKILPVGELATHWIINSYECRQQPISPEIEAMIKKFQNNSYAIDYILIDPDTAGRLWLEGKLTQAMFISAIEDDDTVILTAEFDGNPYKMVIRSKTVEPFSLILAEQTQTLEIAHH